MKNEIRIIFKLAKGDFKIIEYFLAKHLISLVNFFFTKLFFIKKIDNYNFVILEKAYKQCFLGIVVFKKQANKVFNNFCKIRYSNSRFQFIGNQNRSDDGQLLHQQGLLEQRVKTVFLFLST